MSNREPHCPDTQSASALGLRVAIATRACQVGCGGGRTRDLRIESRACTAHIPLGALKQRKNHHECSVEFAL